MEIIENNLVYNIDKSDRTISVYCRNGYEKQLKEAKIKTDFEIDGEQYRVTYIPIQGFRGCITLKRIEIPAGIDRLLRSTFRDCTRLEYAYIPTTVKILLPCIFDGCCNLKKISFENLEGVKIGRDVFSGMKSERVIIEDKASGEEYPLKEFIERFCEV